MAFSTRERGRYTKKKVNTHKDIQKESEILNEAKAPVYSSRLDPGKLSEIGSKDAVCVALLIDVAIHISLASGIGKAQAGLSLFLY
jgi:hypothetical protein